MIESVSHNKLKALALFIIQSSNNNRHYDNATKFSMTPNKSHRTDRGKTFFIFTTKKAEFTNLHSVCSLISNEENRVFDLRNDILFYNRFNTEVALLFQKIIILIMIHKLE